VIEVNIADIGGYGEAGGHRQAGAGHLRESGALTTQNVFHLAVAVGRAAAEGKNVFAHFVSNWFISLSCRERKAECQTPRRFRKNPRWWKIQPASGAAELSG